MIVSPYMYCIINHYVLSMPNCNMNITNKRRNCHIPLLKTHIGAAPKSSASCKSDNPTEDNSQTERKTHKFYSIDFGCIKTFYTDFKSYDNSKKLSSLISCCQWFTTADLEALEVAKAIIRPVVPHVSVMSRTIFIRTHRIPPTECVYQPCTLNIATTCTMREELMFTDKH